MGIEVPDPPKEMCRFLVWDTGLLGIDLLVSNKDLGSDCEKRTEKVADRSDGLLLNSK